MTTLSLTSSGFREFWFRPFRTFPIVERDSADGAGEEPFESVPEAQVFIDHQIVQRQVRARRQWSLVDTKDLMRTLRLRRT